MSPAQTSRITALVVALLNLGQAHAQDWDRRHAFAKSYCGLSWIGVPAMGEGLLVDEDVVEPHPTHVFRGDEPQGVRRRRSTRSITIHI